ncbi:E3 ubiquitin-protein ligase Topors-like isoform X2 [Cheilinus undulatus]|uniref:E3 ubiquitin-protein ligase Topors-like isoform X2 n=1 Tax=Cheilinus undulatus TaxID=241271 RepID=UPI001BD503E0|nr:E3 ubiquitin-protein ligase Topors-like isoform X2 [Cheilinus undulatus]
MPLSVRRKRKNPDEKLPDRPGESTSSAQVMAPTRMKLRGRRRDRAAEGAGASEAGGWQAQEEEETSGETTGRASRRKNNNTLPPAAAASSSSPPSSSASASARAVMAAEEASPDSKCPICLDRFNNLAYLDRCLHRFCFPCIQEWSHNKAECPLCKQPFTSILHSIRGEDDFKEYMLRPAPATNSVAATIAMVAAMASAATSNHQMRLMMRRHRGGDGGETTTRRRRRARGGEGVAGRRGQVWEWYLDSPPPAPLSLPHAAVSPVVDEEAEELEEQRRRADADPSDRGVLFEGLTAGLGGAVAPLPPTDRESRRLMTRLAARQRLQREGGTVRRLRERETVSFRRALYRCSIRVRGVAGVSGNQGQQQRDITAESFRRNPVHLNRLRPWLRRELTVLYGAHGSLVDIVKRIIMARLARHGLEDTPTIEEELRPFLLARTDHFLHELVSFARSPLSLENYDLQAVYEPPDAALELDGTSSSSDSSSVIAISEGEEEEGRGGGGSTEMQPMEAHDDVIQTGSCLSMSAWDDETPGPSYSTAEPSCSLSSLSFSPAPQEASNNEGAEKAEEEECLIVGYKKPIAERTPELVQLSSDTEEDEEKKEEPEKVPPLPSSAPPLPYLPTIPPSTSGACRNEEDSVKEKGGDGRRRRSWSGSSERSRNSVCTLSPVTPADGERRRDRKRVSSEAAREKRRRKRIRRERGRSGTLYNPNRCIFPAMMRHHSPFHSSADSASPPSPPDSTWSYHCSQVSPLTSSISSPSSCSPSPLFSSPQTPPTPSLSPSLCSSVHHGEKPGGKRKYKSRHLDNDDNDPTWRPSSSGAQRREKRRERREKERRHRTRDRGRRREKERRDAHGASRGDSSRRCRDDRSPSVEIIYEGTINSSATQLQRRKRRRKHRKTQRSSSPVIITLDSDSSHDHVNDSNSSSPLSSQQTVDFSDLPPLPLMNSAGVGGTLNAEFGELPADILDQGSDGAETEPAGQPMAADPIAIDNSDSSDGEVDVENVEESESALGLDEEVPKREAETRTAISESQNAPKPSDSFQKRDPEDLPADSRLLATILNDLKGISSSNFEPNNSLDTRKKRLRDQSEQNNLDFSKERPFNAFKDQNWVSGLPTCSSSIPSLPPQEQHKEIQVREEVTDMPPLLKQASPVRSHNRNTPPPLKHKDAGSPHLFPIPPFDVHSASLDRIGVDPRVLPAPPVDSHSGSEQHLDNRTIPPISTLKRHFTSSLALLDSPSTSSSSAVDSQSSCRLASVDFHLAAPSKVGALSVDVHSTSHKHPIDSCSSLGSQNSENLVPHQDFMSVYSSKSCSSRNSTKEAPPVDLHHENSLSPVDFNSAKSGWSKEKPAYSGSTSRGSRNEAQSSNSCQVTPANLHLSCRASTEGSSAGRDDFSGADPNDTPHPVSVSSQTQSPPSPVNSHFSCKEENLSERFSPAPTVDFHRSAVPSLNERSSSFVSDLLGGHLNHTPLPSMNFQSQHRKNSSLPRQVIDSHSDSKPFNHFDPTLDLKINASRSKQQLSVDPQPPTDACSKKSLLPSEDRAVLSVDNHCNSNASADACSDSQSPTDELATSSFLKTRLK